MGDVIDFPKRPAFNPIPLDQGYVTRQLQGGLPAEFMVVRSVLARSPEDLAALMRQPHRTPEALLHGIQLSRETLLGLVALLDEAEARVCHVAERQTRGPSHE